ncbi:peptidase S8 [Pseudoalteromonas sp. GCY]|uniref:fascin domain-containing protein n=1 Tax=Pseudoalteromonas sp. GCY TaxID=2003316 RepID=UPI000BFEEEFD|nr:peptidase S8 [Pseudoalteromonas sp. GCY]PHI36115.1 peptidase S8 [Pseudoalteromonas sp. GCY]QQQ68056.1 peptidase S8 [Pseudoalteromonas sp. GCY]
MNILKLILFTLFGSTFLAHAGTQYVTQAASNITETSAQLNGYSASTIGLSGETFDYGLTTNYGYSALATPAGINGPVSAQIANLECGTEYHFRFRGDPKPPRTTIQGEDLTFTTAPCGPTIFTNVSFETGGQYYFVAENNGGNTVNANRIAIGPWERFNLIDVNGGNLFDGDTIHIQTATGYYFVAKQGGGAELNANRTVASIWETFTIELPNNPGALIQNGDKVALKSINGHYIQAAGNGGAGANVHATVIGCNATYPCSWEMFKIIF